MEFCKEQHTTNGCCCFLTTHSPSSSDRNPSEQGSWRAHLPALVCGAVVGIVFGDVGVDAAERQLLVWGR